MAGQVYLSNRLQKLYDSAGQLGDYFEGDRKLKLERERQLRLDKMAADESAAGIASQAAMTEARTLENDRTKRITGLTEQLGQAETGNVMGPTQSGDFQAGMADPWSGMKDRIRAKMFTEAGTPTTSDQLKAGREGEALGRLRLSQADTRAQEAHASNLKTEEAQRGLIGANTTRAKADAERIDTAPAKPPTEGQSNAALYGRRMQLAMSDLESLRGEGYKPESVAAGVGRAVSKIPLVGNLLSSGESQQAKNAEINFLTAVLRRESGATIQPSEFASGEKLYFDRPGDTKETLEQKARNRSQALEGLRAAAGPAWENVAPVNRGGASGSWGAPPANDRKALAEQALNDPEATEQEKAQARRILGR